MKKAMKFTAILYLILTSSVVMAQEKKTGEPTKQVETASKVQEVKIQTSAQCSMCGEKITKAVRFEKGVRKASLDVETGLVTVEFKRGKTSADALRKAIAAVGYDADDVKAEAKAYDKLDKCCKKPE